MKVANRDAERDGDDRDPRVAADPAHVEAHVERGGDVEADQMHQRDRRSGGPEHLEHRTHCSRLTKRAAYARAPPGRDDAAARRP